MEKPVLFKTTTDLKSVLANNYQKQINNYFGDEKKALKFLSSVISSVQRIPELLNCDPTTVINSFMVMAELELMPSGVSGEAYVLPYAGKAQFQLGYQGLITLFYRAGVRSINAEIVYKKDKFSFINGIVEHNPDVFSDRGEAIGAYVIIELPQGGKVYKVMSKKDIMEFKEFSKSKASSYSPWNQKNDPELWMWKKTVLKQAGKLVPKNETINKAVAYDNDDSVIAEKIKEREEVTKRLGEAKVDGEAMKMGNLLKTNENDQANKNEVEGEPANDNQEYQG